MTEIEFLKKFFNFKFFYTCSINSMASDDCVSAFSALDEAPLAPLYGSDFVGLGTRVLMSSLNALFESKIVFNTLKEIIPAQVFSQG